VIFVLKWPKEEFVSLRLAAFCLTKSLLCNVAIYLGMLFIFRVFYSDMCFKKILCRFQEREVGSQASVRTAQYNIRTLISQQHSSGRRGNTIRTPINVQKFRTVQGCIRLDVSATRLDVQQVNGFLCRHVYGKTATTIQTTGLHHPDAILAKARRGEDLKQSRHQVYTVKTPVLIMEIACSKSAIIWTLGQHRPDTVLFRKDFQRCLESWLHSCPLGRPYLASGRCLEKIVSDSF
jgi:hypothetical protein